MKCVIVCLAVVILCEIPNGPIRTEASKSTTHARHLSSHSWDGLPLGRHWRHNPISEWHHINGWPLNWRRPWRPMSWISGWGDGWGDWTPTTEENIPVSTPSNMIPVTSPPDEGDGPNVCTYKKVRYRPTHFRPRWFRKYYIIVKKCCPGFITVEGEKGCPKEINNIVEEVEAQGLSDFAQALSSANITEKLRGDGPFTVFAPNNEAVKEFLDSKYYMNKEGLTKMMLLHHIVLGKIVLEDLRTHQSLETMHKEMLVDITVSRDRKTILVQGTKVLNHFVARNGILYVIDRVIPPPGETVSQFLKTRPEFSTLESLIKKSGFQFESSLTLFASTNKAFEKIDPNIFERPCLNLKNFIKYHMVPGRLFLQEINSPAAKLRTIEGSLLNLVRNNDSFTVEDATVKEPDIVVFDGVIHVIDEVLLPTTAMDVVEVAESLNATKFVSLLRETKTNKLLQGSGNFTLFTPLNKAFEQSAVTDIFNDMSKEELERTLFFHGMDYIFKLKDFRDDKLFDTLSPVDRMRTNIYKYGTKLTVNGVCLTHVPVQACNGLVYPLDEVLLPPKETILQLLETHHETHNFTILASLIKRTNMTSLLAGPGPVTLFGPTDQAFTITMKKKIKGMTDSQVAELLKYHMISRTIFSSALTPSISTPYQIIRYHKVIRVPSMQGRLLSFSWFNGYLRVNKIHVEESDVLATNGVIHFIDGVLKLP